MAQKCREGERESVFLPTSFVAQFMHPHSQIPPDSPTHKCTDTHIEQEEGGKREMIAKK